MVEMRQWWVGWEEACMKSMNSIIRLVVASYGLVASQSQVVVVCIIRNVLIRIYCNFGQCPLIRCRLPSSPKPHWANFKTSKFGSPALTNNLTPAPAPALAIKLKSKESKVRLINLVFTMGESPWAAMLFLLIFNYFSLGFQ